MPKIKAKKYTKEDLVSIIDSRKASALGSETGEDTISYRRRDLLSRYMGAKLGDERAGQSQVVTRECMEAVEWTLPSLLRVFASLDLLGEFTPLGKEDELPAKQESQAVNHVFFTLNGGFMTLYTAIKDVLMNPVAYVKVYWDEATKIVKESYEGLLAADVEAMMEDPEVEILAQEEVAVIHQTPMGPVEVPSYNLEISRKKKTGSVKIDPVPGEEVLIEGRFQDVSLESAAFVCHTRLVSRSELVASGFDKDLISELSAYDRVKDETDDRQIDTTGGSVPYDETIDPSQELVEVDEAHMLLDIDGDGVSERVKITKSGKEILDIEDTDYQPLIAATSVPMPHTHVGLSWQELVLDLQGVNTTLTRQFLNNLYRVNNPRTVIGRGVNLNDFLNDLPTHPIRATDVNALRVEPVQPIVGNILPTFQYFETKAEGRTGVSRATKGLDADALSRVTKGAFLGSLEQANQRIELLTRIIAESLIKPLFLKIHRLLQQHQTDNIEAKIKGSWQTISPSKWRDRDNMKVLVGLGTGNKQAQMMILDRILMLQKEMLTGGGYNKWVSDDNIFNAASRMIELADLPDPEKYFMDPAKISPQQKEAMAQAAKQNAPDDALAAAQMEMAKVEREKANLKHQEETQKIQLSAQKEQMAAQQKIQELQTKLQQAQRDFALQAHDLKRKDREFIRDTEVKQAELMLEANGLLNDLQQQTAQGMNQNAGPGNA